MTDHEQHFDLTTYFDTRYEVAKRVPFVADDQNRIRLCDHEYEAARRCRYCGRGRPDVTFKMDAHAFPDFLGNLSVFSMNECDACNEHFGRGCEDQLSKQTMLARTLAGIPRKKSRESTFKSNDGMLRIDSSGSNVDIRVPIPNSVIDLLVDGKAPDEIPLTGDTASQPYIPIQAAMALVKIACSVCPKEDLGQCQVAIDWLMGRRTVRFSQFPVSFAFSPGAINDKASEVVVLRRNGDGAEPYLWSVVQFRNFRYQVFVPCCPADESWSREGSMRPVTLKHYPSRFGPDWPFGPTKYFWGDWSGTEPVRTTAKVSHQVVQVIGMARPPQEAG